MAFTRWLIISSLLLGLCGCKSPTTSWKHDEQGLYAAQLSRYGDFLLIASVNKSAQLWDFKNYIKLHTWTNKSGSQTNFTHVALSADGNIAITADARSIAVWNAKSGQSLGFWLLKGFITKVKISANGKLALVAFSNNFVQLVNLQYGSSVWQAKHAAYIESIALSMDGNYAMVGCDDNTATLWDMKNNQRKFIVENTNKIRFSAISPKNNYVLTSSPFQTIKIWDMQTGNLLYELREINNFLKFMSRPVIHVSSVSFSDDEKFLITGAPPRNIYLWNLETGNLIDKFIIPKHSIWKPTSAIVYATAISKEQSTIFAEASNGFGYVWELSK